YQFFIARVPVLFSVSDCQSPWSCPALIILDFLLYDCFRLRRQSPITGTTSVPLSPRKRAYRKRPISHPWHHETHGSAGNDDEQAGATTHNRNEEPTLF